MINFFHLTWDGSWETANSIASFVAMSIVAGTPVAQPKNNQVVRDFNTADASIGPTTRLGTTGPDVAVAAAAAQAPRASWRSSLTSTVWL